MANLISKLRKLARLNRLPGRGTAVPSPGNALALDEDAVRNLMRQVEKTPENQYSCEETFALLDEYVELATSEEDAAVLMPLVERHINHCPDCNEHYQTLLTILQTE